MKDEEKQKEPESSSREDLPELLSGSPGGLAAGFGALPRGALYLFQRPRFWLLAGLPLAINILLFGVVFYFTILYGLPWMVGALTPDLPWAPVLLRRILQILVGVIALILVGMMGVVSFTSVGMILAAPFNDLLSEWVEGDLLHQANQRPLTLANLMEDLGRILWQATRKMIVVVLAFAVSLPLLILPVVGPVLYTVVNSLVATWYTALEYLDLPMSRAGWNLARRRQWAWDRRFTTLGFGGGVYLTMLVPLLGLLVMPAAVAGATILWVEMSDPRTSETVLSEPPRSLDQSPEGPTSS